MNCHPDQHELSPDSGEIRPVSIRRNLAVATLMVLVAAVAFPFDLVVSHSLQLDRIPGDLRKSIMLSEFFAHGFGVAIIFVAHFLWSQRFERSYRERLAALFYPACWRTSAKSSLLVPDLFANRPPSRQPIHSSAGSPLQKSRRSRLLNSIVSFRSHSNCLRSGDWAELAVSTRSRVFLIPRHNGSPSANCFTGPLAERYSGRCGTCCGGVNICLGNPISSNCNR